MDQTNSVSWQDDVTLEATSAPGVAVSAIAEAAPTLTVMTIIGISTVVLVVIVIVFLLGVFIDCRQQKMLEKKINEAKRAKNHRHASAYPDGDAAIIVDNMEEAELSVPAAATLTNIP